MKGITFYKLNSPYPEDVTKNCGLTGSELDQNFFNLKTMDIKSGYWDKEKESIILERIDDSYVIIDMTGVTTDFKFEYDETNGVLHVQTPGTSFDVTGFTTPDMLRVIYSDNTIDGQATIKEPMTISPLFRTGMYRPVVKTINTIEGETLPHPKDIMKGSRFLTIENVSDYGLLYNYKGIKKIAMDLECQHSEWRVPTKTDWDGMLNAIELCDIDRNHNNPASNRALGKFAGAFLKANYDWLTPNIVDEDGPSADDMNPYPYAGVDSYGFTILPAGYGDGGIVIDYFKQRAAFWTKTQLNLSDVYAKRFDYNRTKVYQEAIGTEMQLSLRLVKDYTGDNFQERETINGFEYSCVLMPDQDGKTKIWTQTNVAFSNPQYNGVEPNGGEDLTYSQKYFINEWTGTRWIKNELKNGESVVIIQDADGNEDFDDYRNVNGVLTSFSSLIYQKIIIEISEQLNNLDAKIEAEIIRATAAEEALGKRIDDISGDTQLREDLEAEIAARIAADELLAAADAALNEAITAETLAREANDTLLQQAITAETATREANDINLDRTYIIDVVNGLTLYTNGGAAINISVDSDYGLF